MSTAEGAGLSEHRRSNKKLSLAEQMQVIEIRKTSGISQQKLALQFGCSKTQIQTTLDKMAEIQMKFITFLKTFLTSATGTIPVPIFTHLVYLYFFSSFSVGTNYRYWSGLAPNRVLNSDLEETSSATPKEFKSLKPG